MCGDDIWYLISSRVVGWIWLAPPCSSFSTLRNLGPAGCGARTPDDPYGDEVRVRILQLPPDHLPAPVIGEVPALTKVIDTATDLIH